MDVVATLIELKSGASANVENWQQYISTHREEALETLRAEGVTVESWFSLSLHGKDYLLCYMRADSMKTAQSVASSSINPVDAFHKQFLRDNCPRGGFVNCNLLVDLSAQTRNRNVSAETSKEK